ncbi:MAG: NUDIX domain-containing protein [Planctomycetaceae bacterium]|nr:NUDIX domain-containing protein [Planctomycetaceae bacterium]
MEKHFTASAVIQHDGKILLVWHNKLSMWLYPGGHIEQNETPDECLIREVKEETGLDVAFVDSPRTECKSETVGVLHNPAIIFDEQIGDGNSMHHHIDLVYMCYPIGNTGITLAHKELGRYGWFAKEEIAEMALPYNLKTFLLSL